MLILKHEWFLSFSPFPGCSLWLQPCVTHLKSANYTQAQSLIEAVDIEQPAVVNYFFAILPGKAMQTSVKQRSVSLKSIHPDPLWHDFNHYKRYVVLILFSWYGHDWHSRGEQHFQSLHSGSSNACSNVITSSIDGGFSCKCKNPFFCQI